MYYKEGTNITYKVNEKKKAVTCKIVSKGQSFFGVAICDGDDEFDLERGKGIAYNKAEIAQRKSDYASDVDFINYLKAYVKAQDDESVESEYLSAITEDESYDFSSYDNDAFFLKHIVDIKYNGGRMSKLAMYSIQETSESMKLQSLHIKLCEDIVDALSKGNEFVFDEVKYAAIIGKKLNPSEKEE